MGTLFATALCHGHLPSGDLPLFAALMTATFVGYFVANSEHLVFPSPTETIRIRPYRYSR